MKDLIYILSPSYSGSTLLTRLLGAHSDIGTVGELKATHMGDVEHYRCSCGQPLRSCAFWKSLEETLRDSGVAFDPSDFGTHFRGDGWWSDKLLRSGVRGKILEGLRDAGLSHGPAKWTYRQVLDRNRAMVDAVAAVQNARTVLDGSKDPVRLRHLLAGGHWRVRTIYLLRDGRGTACSYMKHTGASMRKAAAEWRNTQHQCLRMFQSLPPAQRRTCRYEDVCAAPRDVLRELIGFLDLQEDGCLRRLGDAPSHILGNRMRLQPAEPIRLDESWKQTLTDEDRSLFDRIAGPLNRELGYV